MEQLTIDLNILLVEAIVGGNKDPEYVTEVTQPMPWWGWIITIAGASIMTYISVTVNF